MFLRVLREIVHYVFALAIAATAGSNFYYALQVQSEAHMIAAFVLCASTIYWCLIPIRKERMK